MLLPFWYLWSDYVYFSGTVCYDFRFSKEWCFPCTILCSSPSGRSTSVRSQWLGHSETSHSPSSDPSDSWMLCAVVRYGNIVLPTDLRHVHKEFAFGCLLNKGIGKQTRKRFLIRFKDSQVFSWCRVVCHPWCASQHPYGWSCALLEKLYNISYIFESVPENVILSVSPACSIWSYRSAYKRCSTKILTAAIRDSIIW